MSEPMGGEPRTQAGRLLLVTLIETSDRLEDARRWQRQIRDIEQEAETSMTSTLRGAASAALDEWDSATKDWLEWFARGGTGSHAFPVVAANNLRVVLGRFARPIGDEDLTKPHTHTFTDEEPSHD